MIGKVKKWLGIEGVKLELDMPEEVVVDSGEISGTIRFSSMHTQMVQTIRIVLIEKYKRGRRKNKMIDEYKLGEIELVEDIEVPADTVVEVEFQLPFELVESEMDALQGKNFIFRGLVKTAKLLKGAKSTYRLEAEADVKGVALNPFDKKEVNLIL